MYLTVFTILMSYLLGYVGVVYSPVVLLLSGITTLFLFSGLDCMQFKHVMIIQNLKHLCVYYWN